MKQRLLLWFFVSGMLATYGQSDSVIFEPITKKLTFIGDFRMRAEQDWNSVKSDGSFRSDRTRLRYRLRAGFNYKANDWATFGARIRTGNPNKQQDSQLTLGDGFGEYAALPLSFEKVFFKAEKNGGIIWLGKNRFPFEKSNELFWSENVYPDGIYLGKKIKLESSVFNDFKIGLGHFIMRSSGASLDQDSYLQAAQLSASFFNQHLVLFPSFYYFKNMANIPDGGGSFEIDYAILHIGSKLSFLADNKMKFTIDFYNNLSDYSNHDSIQTNLKDQRKGWVVGLGYGKLKKKNDWLFELTYANLERFAVVDYMAQNDWARWDYSSNGSPDGRLSNFQGASLTLGYAINEKIAIKLKYYKVEQLIAYGPSKENGDRIRLDFDIKF